MPLLDVVKVVAAGLAAIIFVAWFVWVGYRWTIRTARTARQRGTLLRAVLAWIGVFVLVSPLASIVWAMRAGSGVGWGALRVTGEHVVVGITLGILAAGAVAFRVARGPLCGRCQGSGKVRSKSGEWKACTFCEGTGLMPTLRDQR
jgi:hypothetical protein